MNNDFLIKSYSANIASAVQSMISRSCFIEFGVIKNITGNGIVEVAVSVAKNPQDTKVITCVLIAPSGSSAFINIVPVVGDKVLILSPRRFNAEMFNKQRDDFIIDENAIGYSSFTCLAMLCNQFRSSDYKNYIEINNGNISIKYTEEQVALNVKAVKENKELILSDDHGNSISMSTNGTVINGKLTVK